VAEFDWNEHNEKHIQDHGLEPWEVEDAFCDPDVKTVDAYDRGGEKRWALLGATEAGQLLFAVFTKRHGAIRVVTARPATPKDKRRYQK
jgi:uncharacterized DUF497 family protein